MLDHFEIKPYDIGKLSPLLEDASITEIMVNGLHGVFVERAGTLQRTEIVFEHEDEILQIIANLFGPQGRTLDAAQPMGDVRLEDGTRVNAVLRPVAATGPTLTIRKIITRRLSWDDLLSFDCLSPQMLDFLRLCVQAQLNIVISGGTGAGKTTVFNLLAEFFRPDERVVIAEQLLELQMRHPHLIVLEGRAPDADGRGAITVPQLIDNARKMRPDRIITGEVNGPEAWEMLEVMTTGYDGSMFSLHADDARDAIDRIEFMCTTGGRGIPLLDVRRKLVSAVDLLIQQTRLPDGSRRIVSLSEISGMENNAVSYQPIFEFVPTGRSEGRISGVFRPTGYRPAFLKKFAAHGISLPSALLEE